MSAFLPSNRFGETAMQRYRLEVFEKASGTLWLVSWLLLLGAFFASQPAGSRERIGTYRVPDAHVVGQASLQVLFWDVLDATLLAPNGKYDPAKPFALALSYRRNFNRDSLVNASIDEMASQSQGDSLTLDQWEKTLHDIFPDVKRGDELIGVKNAEGFTEFFFQGEQIGTVQDREFTSAFFDIWLGESTSRPDFRDALLGRTL